MKDKNVQNGPAEAPASWLNRRSSARYAYQCPVSLQKNGQRYGVGELIDISREGAAFKSFSPVQVGQSYTINIKGFGSFEATVVRSFDVHCYGVHFTIGDDQKRRLGKRLEEKLTPIS